MTTSVELEFGPGRYRFFLPLKAQIEVERLCGNKAIGTIYDELCGSVGINQETGAALYLPGPARAKDAYEVIRLAAQYGSEGFVSGQRISVSAIDATRLVDQYVDGRPYAEFMPVAWGILKALLTGIQLDAPKKKEPRKRTSRSNGVKS